MELIWVAVMSRLTGAPLMMTPAGRRYHQQGKVPRNVETRSSLDLDKQNFWSRQAPGWGLWPRESVQVNFSMMAFALTGPL